MVSVGIRMLACIAWKWNRKAQDFHLFSREKYSALSIEATSSYNCWAPGMISQITIFIDISHKTLVVPPQIEEELF